MSESTSLNRLLAAMAGRSRETIPWLGAMQEEARKVFAGSGLPSRRIESWRYSDLARALARLPQDTSVPRPSPALPGAHTALFKNGVLSEERSACVSNLATPMRQILADPATPYADQIGHIHPQKNHALLNLNTALMEDGLVLHVPAYTALTAPFHVLYEWKGEEARAPEGRHLRILVLLGEGAKATLVESHHGAPGFSTIVTEIGLGAGAMLSHLRLEGLGSAATQSAITLVGLGEAASYNGFYLSEGGWFSRHEALLELTGPRAKADLSAIYLVADGRHCDNTTVITHTGPDTASSQAFRGVLTGDSRGVYQGCVCVQQEAQGTDARQMSRAVLLSRQAEIAIKPELEILADNVKCSHGATSGEFDNAALFFLRGRGIPEAEARSLLVEAFLSEIIETIEARPIREITAAAVSGWLAVHASEISHAE